MMKKIKFTALLSGGNAYYIKNTLSYYSDEDENQATVAPKNYKYRFFANIESIYFKDKMINNKEFYKFLSKFNYSSLYHSNMKRKQHRRVRP